MLLRYATLYDSMMSSRTAVSCVLSPFFESAYHRRAGCAGMTPDSYDGAGVGRRREEAENNPSALDHFSHGEMSGEALAG